MVQENGGFQARNPRYKAEVRPYFPKRSRIPELDRKDFLGKRGQFYTTLRFWVYGATFEYPEVAVNISLSNGSGSAFTQITSEDLDNLILKLQEWKNDFLAIKPKLEADKNRIDEGWRAAQQQVNMLRTLGVQNSNQIPEEMEDESLSIPPEVMEAIVKQYTQIPLPEEKK